MLMEVMKFKKIHRFNGPGHAHEISWEGRLKHAFFLSSTEKKHGTRSIEEEDGNRL
jgi:hypothetical protein